MKNFIDILTESAKTYKLKIRIAGEMPEDFQDTMETALQKYELINCSAGKRTPIQEKPLDFPQLQNMEVHNFECEVKYPTTPHVLEHYLVNACGVTHSHIIVRGENDPIETQQDGIASSETYQSMLDTEEMSKPDPEAHKQVGGGRVMELLKELEKASKEKEIDPIADIKPGDSKDISPEQNNTSPIGSK